MRKFIYNPSRFRYQGSEKDQTEITYFEGSMGADRCFDGACISSGIHIVAIIRLQTVQSDRSLATDNLRLAGR